MWFEEYCKEVEAGNIILGKKMLKLVEKVKPYFDDIRYSVDKLELLVDDSEWELPKYREMLFLR